MKRLITVTAAVIMSLLFVGSSFAAEGVYGSAGCGLGSILFGKEPGPVQIFAATTNGTSFNQWFGISSGTSNCNKNTKFSANDRLNAFVLANMDNIAKEIAMGHGESLDTLAELMEVPAEQRMDFNQKLQSNFNTIFPSENVVLASVVNNIVAVTSVN